MIAIFCFAFTSERWLQLFIILLMLYSYLYIGSLMSLGLFSRTCICCLVIISNTSHLINCSSCLLRFLFWDVIESSDGRLHYLNTSFTYLWPITSIRILHVLAEFLSFYFSPFLSLFHDFHQLDNVSAGTTEWKGLLKDYWARFSMYCKDAGKVEIRQVWSGSL